MRSKRPDKFTGILAALTLLLVLSAVGAVRPPQSAVALEQAPRCGLAEHVHTADCYINDVLVCGQKAHTHSQDCYAVLLRDNDINTLLTRIDETPDKSLEAVISGDAAMINQQKTTAPSAATRAETPLSSALVFNEGLHIDAPAANTDSQLPAAMYAQPDTCTVSYAANDLELFQDDSLQSGALYTLQDVPEGYARWRSGETTYAGGQQITVSGDLTLTAVRYVTVTFRQLDGSSTTQQILQGDSVVLPSGGYWTDETGASLSGGSAAAVWDDAVFTAVSGQPLTVEYEINWSTPSQLRNPVTTPAVTGPTSVEVAAGDTLAVSTVSSRTVACPFQQRPDRYGTVYFVGWRTETDEVIQPSTRVGYNELSNYDYNGDGTVSLTGVWRYHQLQSVNFFVKFNSVNPGEDIGQEHYTSVIFATYVGGLEDAVKIYNKKDTINQVYAINLGRSDDYLTYDKQIRRLYGSDTAPWLAEFPDDSYIFEQLKQYAKNGQLSVPNDNGETELVNVNDLSADSYAIRWYLFTAAGDGPYSDWHIDGALVRKEGKARVSKTFAGNATLLDQNREDFYIHAANEDGKKNYILTTSAVSAQRQEAILSELGLSSSQITGWLTPIDDGDTDANTMLWEFGDMDYGEIWTVTEHPPDLEDTVSRAEWSVADASGLNASASGSGHTVTIRGVTQATDLEEPDWPHIFFNNIYFRSDSLMLKKEDAATGHALAGAEFQFYQNDRLMTFDYDDAAGLYVYNRNDTGAVSVLTCSGYTNVSTTGFSYSEGDITIREVTVPTGYNRVNDVTLGYTADSDGDGIKDSTIGITSNSGAFARYDNGLLIIENSSDPIDVTVTKKWNCADSERADVVMQLLANGSATTAASILQDSGQSVTVMLTEVYGWSHTWKSLPVYASGDPVTWSVREIKIGNENCKTDYTFPNWIASYRTEAIELDRLSLVVENTPKRPMLYLEKRNITGKKLLEGAEFTLIAVDENDNALPGAVAKTAVTGPGGTLSFDNLRYNTRYRLTETKAPQDYLPYEEPAYLTIAENGTVEVESHGYVSSAGTAYHIRALNRGAYSLPESGGPGAALFYASGGVLLLAALGGAALHRRKRSF